MRAQRLRFLVSTINFARVQSDHVRLQVLFLFILRRENDSEDLRQRPSSVRSESGPLLDGERRGV